MFVVKNKEVAKLIRPALHVQGCWAHGFGYHLAVSDADFMHNTNNNVEVICRMLEQVYAAHGGLPHGLHLQQDNTSRECKNQKIIKWAIKLVSLNVFGSVSLNYLRKSHTHIDLDATFGQITVRLGGHEFDDDNDVVELLSGFVKDIGVDPFSKEATLAYKLDEAPDWETWWDEVNVEMSRLTGERAPHYFRICRRHDLGQGCDLAAEKAVAAEQHRGSQPSGGDVMLVIKHYMHSAQVSQILTVWPEVFQSRSLSKQPGGSQKRRTTKDDAKKKVAALAENLYAGSHISGKARNYLVEWARNMRRKCPRPDVYRFLEHSCLTSRFRAGPLHDVERAIGLNRVVVHVRAVPQEGDVGPPLNLPIQPESDDDADGAVLQVQDRSSL